MPDDRNTSDKSAKVVMAWRNWLLLFVPGFAVIMVLMHWLGFYPVLPWLIGLLIAVLLYQRFVNKRTWRSIMWGVYAPDE